MEDGEQLERGRAFTAAGAWRDAHEALSSADRSGSLGAEELALLATAAYMCGLEDEFVSHLERVHQLHADAGETARAARTGFWIGMHLMSVGDVGRGTGWLGRAQRLVEAIEGDCVERGYLMMPLAFQREAMGQFAEGAAVAGEAAAVAERFAEPDLFALALHMQGHLLVRAGRVAAGLALLDEAMVTVTTAQMSPIATGMVYCGVIMGCQDAYEPRRAQEWTEALSRWCLRQPDMVAFSGRCHVHRAEIMQLSGAWGEALEEARYATSRAVRGNHRRALAESAYVQGEVYRLRGDFNAAQQAYHDASGHGRDPQPGLALLRLAEGNVGAAVAAIRRVLHETTAAPERMRLLPACAEILVAAGEMQEARRACEELDELAAGHDVGVLKTIVAQTRGAVELGCGDPATALAFLRRACREWDDVDAPYETARVRALIGAACAGLGDGEAAELELERARNAFAELGAKPDAARVERLAQGAAPADGPDPSAARSPHALTPRELEVLRLVAAARTNRAIAAELVLSERTVERHVSNIFVKLGVSSRAGATAYAYEHDLL